MKKGLLFFIYSLFFLSAEVFAFEIPDITFKKPREKLEEKGIVFSALYTGDMVSNLAGGLRRKTTYVGDVEIALEVDLEKAGLIPGGKIYVSGDDSHGGTFPTRNIGDLQYTDNLEAPHDVRLYEWWYEQSFFREKLSVLVGAQDIAGEFAVSHYGSLYINTSFGTSPDILANVWISTFPYVGLGTRVKIKPREQFEFLAGIYDGDPSDNEKNRHGVSYRLSSRQGLMLIFEGAYHQRIKFNDCMEPLPGSIKFGSWLHTQNIDDVLSTDGDGNPLRHRNDYGFYGIIDQMLFREKNGQGPGAFFSQLLKMRNPETEEDEGEPRGLGAFFQFGGAPSDRNIVAYYFGAGLNYTGLVPGRGQDVLGVAVANAFLSGRLRKSRDLEIEAFDPADGAIPGQLRANESVLETTYRIRLNDYVSLQPDYQIVFNPSGEQNIKTAHVFTLRFEAGF